LLDVFAAGAQAPSGGGLWPSWSAPPTAAGHRSHGHLLRVLPAAAAPLAEPGSFRIATAAKPSCCCYIQRLVSKDLSLCTGMNPGWQLHDESSTPPPSWRP